MIGFVNDPVIRGQYFQNYKNINNNVSEHHCQNGLCKILVLYVHQSSPIVEVGKIEFGKSQDFLMGDLPYICDTLPSLNHRNFTTELDIYIL